MKKNKKPSFFVAGMQKSGTTTLHKWLNSHPEITLPNYKETHFFSDEKQFSKGFKWYLNNLDWCNNICSRTEYGGQRLGLLNNKNDVE